MKIPFIPKITVMMNPKPSEPKERIVVEDRAQVLAGIAASRKQLFQSFESDVAVDAENRLYSVACMIKLEEEGLLRVEYQGKRTTYKAALAKFKKGRDTSNVDDEGVAGNGPSKVISWFMTEV